MSGCTTQQVSWLTLEQYRLGDLSSAAHSKIEAHLSECGSCVEDLAAINSDERKLGPLPEMAEKQRSFDFVSRRFALVTSLSLAACAVLLVFVVGIFEDAPHLSNRPSRLSFKGGELALSIVRERDGLTSQAPTHFKVGDRFSLYLTHPLPHEVTWEVVVFQGGEPSFPYVDHSRIRSGNKVPVPGAFRLTENLPATICLMIGEVLPSRFDIESGKSEKLPDSTVCVELIPVGKNGL